MNNGYAMGAAGVLTSMFRQDVAANNLANIETPGFKPDYAFTIPRDTVRQEDNVPNLPSNTLLEKLGAGVLLAPVGTSHKQGSVVSSRNPFDLAIQGPGFFTVSAGTGTQGLQTRLTRDGRMLVNHERQLVTAAEGYQVLDASGRPITLDPGKDFSVAGDGTVTQGGQAVAKLSFTDVPDKRSLTKVGEGLYQAPANAQVSNLPAAGTIVQGALEQSGSDPIKAMMAVNDASSQVNYAIKMMQIHDALMDRAINTLGRVSA